VLANHPAIWISIAAAAISGTSALIAFLSYRVARQSLRLNQQLADRRAPRLLLSFQEGYVKKNDPHNVYALLISISNPTDIDNSVAQLDLRVEYRPASDFCARVDVPAAADNDDGPNIPTTVRLVPPLKVAAHQTVVGWVRFQVKRALLMDCKIDGYTVVARDSHGQTSTVEMSIIREVVDV